MKKLLNILAPHAGILSIMFLILYSIAQADFAIYSSKDTQYPDRSSCDLPVLRIIDGDTFTAQTVTTISPTVKVVEIVSFRLLGVNTPERKEPGYQEAKDHLSRRILGKLVHIELKTSGKKRDSFGRFLAYVSLCTKKGLVSINLEMLATGHAKEFRK